MISERLNHLAAALRLMIEKRPVLSVAVPVRLRNTANSREHWRATAKRAKVARDTTRMLIRAEIAGKVFPLAVRLVYVGPRQLDDDGVASAVKSLRDGVADALGVDDRDPRVVWVPDQERGGVREYGARVEIYLG
jgi:hypothetical protein